MNELQFYLRIRFLRHLALILVATNLAAEPTFRQLSETIQYCSDICFKEHITGNTPAIFTKEIFFYQLFRITVYQTQTLYWLLLSVQNQIQFVRISLDQSKYILQLLCFFLTKEAAPFTPLDQRKCMNS
jgi:hypothetical protein